MASLLRMRNVALPRAALSTLRAPAVTMAPCSSALPRAFRMAATAAVRPARRALPLPFPFPAALRADAARTQLTSTSSALHSTGAFATARFGSSAHGGSNHSESGSSSGTSHPLLLPALRGARLAAVLLVSATGTYWLLSVASEADAGRAVRESLSLRQHSSLQLSPREQSAYPLSVLVILGINAGVFVLHRVLPPRLAMTYLFTSVMHMRGGHYVTLLTAVFSHVTPIHLLLNCFAIHLFGRLVVSAIGERDFVISYLAAGLFSSVGALICSRYLGSARLISRAIPQHSLGASGAAFGMIALTAVFFPHMQFSLFLGLVPPMPAETLVPVLCAFDGLGMLYHLVRDSLPTIGHSAHLSGAIFGYIWAHTYLKHFNPRARAFFERQQRLRAMGIKA